MLDTLKLAPLLLVVHVLIEVFEYHAASKIKLNRMLTGRLAPLFGGAVGIIPQCGFSVVAANLYAKRHIRLGTLIAVFIATSDEAVPILLSDVSAAYKLLPLLAFKLVFAVGAGYLINALTRKTAVIAVKSYEAVQVPHGCHGHEIGEHTHGENAQAQGKTEQLEHNNIGDHAHSHSDHAVALSNHEKHSDHEKVEQSLLNAESITPVGQAAESQQGAKKFDWACFVVHPLIHTLTVLGFILAVNLALGILLYFVGEARLEDFMQSARYAQPFLAALIGLIPNCASSVVITQLYASGTLSMGAAFAGLSVNAGLGLAVLLKQNKNAKENLLIVLGLYASSSIIGLLLSFLPF